MLVDIKKKNANEDKKKANYARIVTSEIGENVIKSPETTLDGKPDGLKQVIMDIYGGVVGDKEINPGDNSPDLAIKIIKIIESLFINVSLFIIELFMLNDLTQQYNLIYISKDEKDRLKQYSSLLNKVSRVGDIYLNKGKSICRKAEGESKTPNYRKILYNRREYGFNVNCPIQSDGGTKNIQNNFILFGNIESETQFQLINLKLDLLIKVMFIMIYYLINK